MLSLMEADRARRLALQKELEAARDSSRELESDTMVDRAPIPALA